MAPNDIYKFEDFGKLEDAKIQLVLRELVMDELAVALKGTSNENIAALHRNMSESAVVTLKAIMGETGSVPIGDVEKAQQNIIAIMQDLRYKGVI